ncbi:hypothetical protein F5877DRAFT_82035 [Lentinula edodes]|nr:hypothetical protein F5877DRAFT_82035 [Lentinula edodes]
MSSFSQQNLLIIVAAGSVQASKPVTLISPSNLIITGSFWMRQDRIKVPSGSVQDLLRVPSIPSDSPLQFTTKFYHHHRSWQCPGLYQSPFYAPYFAFAVGNQILPSSSQLAVSSSNHNELNVGALGSYQGPFHAPYFGFAVSNKNLPSSSQLTVCVRIVSESLLYLVIRLCGSQQNLIIIVAADSVQASKPVTLISPSNLIITGSFWMRQDRIKVPSMPSASPLQFATKSSHHRRSWQCPGKLILDALRSYQSLFYATYFALAAGNKILPSSSQLAVSRCVRIVSESLLYLVLRLCSSQQNLLIIVAAGSVQAHFGCVKIVSKSLVCHVLRVCSWQQNFTIIVAAGSVQDRLRVPSIPSDSPLRFATKSYHHRRS